MNRKIDFLKSKGLLGDWTTYSGGIIRYDDGDDVIIFRDSLCSGYIGGMYFNGLRFDILMCNLGWDKEYQLVKRKETIKKILSIQ